MDQFAANFHFLFMNEFINAENRRLLRLEYGMLRDSSNPFEMEDMKFIKLFRLPRQIVVNLIEEISQFFDEQSRITAIPLHLQILVCLNFYGHGSYQTNVGQGLAFPMSQPSVSRILNRISNIFTMHMLPRYVKFPVTEQEITNTKRLFQETLNFPNTIGCIDGTHVAITTPEIDNDVQPAVLYLNRKGFYSINVQLICDASLKFTNVNARFPGATHDAGIWETSTILTHLRRKYLEGERNTWIIGDSGYPLQPWLMTPIPDAAPETPEGIYTARHCSARNVIERSIGVLKQRFRCLFKHRVLHYSPTTAGRIIYACIVLHNICRKNNIPPIEEDIEDDENDDQDDVDFPNPNQYGNANELDEGRFIRRQLIHLIQNE